MLCVAYRLYTHQPGYFLLYTWPVWLVALAILLSPWAFNPKSFEGLSVRTHFHEFLVVRRATAHQPPPCEAASERM